MDLNHARLPIPPLRLGNFILQALAGIAQMPAGVGRTAYCLNFAASVLIFVCRKPYAINRFRPTRGWTPTGQGEIATMCLREKLSRVTT
jgi:hypothetical protein